MKPSKATSKTDKKKEIYVAFSGGGAKAFIHIGALNFLEKNYQISGVAGTSAGALVAVLKAAGFTSKDMFFPSQNIGHNGISPIFEKICKKNTGLRNISELLGGEGLRGLRAAHSAPHLYLLRRAPWGTRIHLAATLLLFSLFIPSAWVFLTEFNSFFATALSTFFLSCISTISWIYYVAFPKSLSIIDGIFENGIACTEKAIAEVEHQVAIKLNIKNRSVLMGDFKMPVRIIAANLDLQKPVIFSNNRTPAVPLRDALSASICIPVAFKPHLYDGHRYIDGGVVSNMPAFVFSEELRLHPKRRIIALKITETKDDLTNETALQKTIKFLENSIDKDFPGSYSLSASRNLVQTLFSGAQDLAHSEMDVFSTELPTSLKLLDFDLNFKQLGHAYEQGQLFADKLVTQSFAVEDIHYSSCEIIARNAKDSMDKIPFLKRREGGLVRVAVAYAPYEGSGVIKIKYGFGFDNSSDGDVVLPIDASVCGKAWTSREVVFEQDNRRITSNLSKYGHISSRINKDIQWILSVPILDRNTHKTRFVINIDSNTKIFDTIQRDPAVAQDIRAMLRNLVELSTLIGTAMLETLDSINEET